MSALDEIIRNYKRVNPFGSSHQQLVDDAAAELAQLREALRRIMKSTPRSMCSNAEAWAMAEKLLGEKL